MGSWPPWFLGRGVFEGSTCTQSGQPGSKEHTSHLRVQPVDAGSDRLEACEDPCHARLRAGVRPCARTVGAAAASRLPAPFAPGARAHTCSCERMSNSQVRALNSDVLGSSSRHEPSPGAPSRRTTSTANSGARPAGAGCSGGGCGCGACGDGACWMHESSSAADAARHARSESCARARARARDRERAFASATEARRAKAHASWHTCCWLVGAKSVLCDALLCQLGPLTPIMKSSTRTKASSRRCSARRAAAVVYAKSCGGRGARTK